MSKKHRFSAVLATVLALSSLSALADGDPYIRLGLKTGEAFLYNGENVATVSRAIDEGRIAEVRVAYFKAMVEHKYTSVELLMSVAKLPNEGDPVTLLLMDVSRLISVEDLMRPAIIGDFLDRLQAEGGGLTYTKKYFLEKISEVADLLPNADAIRSRLAELQPSRYAPKESAETNPAEVGPSARANPATKDIPIQRGFQGTSFYDVDANWPMTIDGTVKRIGVHSENVLSPPDVDFWVHVTKSTGYSAKDELQEGLRPMLELKDDFLKAVSEDPTSGAASTMVDVIVALLEFRDLYDWEQARLFGDFMLTARVRQRVDVVGAVLEAAGAVENGFSLLRYILTQSPKAVEELTKILVDSDVEAKEQKLLGRTCFQERSEMAVLIRDIANENGRIFTSGVRSALAAVPKLYSAELLPDDLFTRAILSAAEMANTPAWEAGIYPGILSQGTEAGESAFTKISGAVKETKRISAAGNATKGNQPETKRSDVDGALKNDLKGKISKDFKGPRL